MPLCIGASNQLPETITLLPIPLEIILEPLRFALHLKELDIPINIKC